MQELSGALYVSRFCGYLVSWEKVNVRENGLRQEWSTAVVALDTLDMMVSVTDGIAKSRMLEKLQSYASLEGDNTWID